MVLAVASSLLARYWLDAEFIPHAPTWGQMLAYVMLMRLLARCLPVLCF